MKPVLKRTTNNNRGAKFTRPHNNRPHQHGKSGAAQRNNLQQSFEKYQTLAREAFSTGDRILAESYYQFAEHYLRTLNEMKPIEVEIPAGEALNKDEEVAAEDEPSVPVAPVVSADQSHSDQSLHS